MEDDYNEIHFFRHLLQASPKKRGFTLVKSIFFDTGPIITLVMARLDWILHLLKEKYGGKFYITPAVKRENWLKRPLKIKTV